MPVHALVLEPLSERPLPPPTSGKVTPGELTLELPRGAPPLPSAPVISDDPHPTDHSMSHAARHDWPPAFENPRTLVVRRNSSITCDSPSGFASEPEQTSNCDRPEAWVH